MCQCAAEGALKFKSKNLEEELLLIPIQSKCSWIFLTLMEEMLLINTSTVPINYYYNKTEYQQ